MSGPGPMKLILIWTAGPYLEAKELEDVLLTTAHPPPPKNKKNHTLTTLRNNQPTCKGNISAKSINRLLLRGVFTFLT